jgi:hypothetical protein
MRFTTRHALIATTFSAMLLVIWMQHREIRTLEHQVSWYKSYQFKQHEKLRKYMKLYWDIVFDNSNRPRSPSNQERSDE